MLRLGGTAKLCGLGVALFSAALAGCTGGTTTSPPPEAREAKSVAGPFRILHIMSYHAPWIWTDDQLRGFKEALADVDVEYEIFQMDTKRTNTAKWLEKVSAEAREKVESFRPDLVYVTDDAAMEHVGRHFAGADVPVVFSGMNHDPDVYGLPGSKNVTGVLEHEHFLQTVRLLLEIVPEVKRIAVVLDDDTTSDGVEERMKKQLSDLPPGVSIVRWDQFLTFDDYKRAVARYQTEVDALALIGTFTFKDENGENVPFELVHEWTANNSVLPDFSFWRSRAPLGTLATVTVSGYEQGFAAGAMARRILVDGESPGEIEMKPTTRGEPVISLARARQLGISVKSGLLLSADVVKTFAWDDETD